MDAAEATLEAALPSWRTGPVAGVSPRSRVVAAGAATAAALVLAQVLLVVSRLDGHFLYTLDDPYIHLTLARQIGEGHYGLQPGVAASPSSSIIYPFLLAGLMEVGLGSWAALLVNALAAMASGGLIGLLAVDAVPGLRAAPTALVAALAACVMLALNLAGLAMTGMEHGLQVALTLAWLVGAWRFLRGGPVTAAWLACAAVLPLVRYEDASLWLAAVAVLALRRRLGAALGLFLAGAAALGAFSLMLHALGLPLLPSSVLVKSSGPAHAGQPALVAAVLHLHEMVASNMRFGEGPFLVCLTLAVAAMASLKWGSADPDDRAAAVLGLVGVAVGAVHLTLGRVDGFSRYTIYIMALDAGVLLIGCATGRRRPRDRGAWHRWSPALAVPVLMLALTCPAQLLVHRSLRSDVAARNIYEQQFQMRRLVADFYRRPVAVNDIGLVSLDDPYPVLDLWGLGSEEARVARLEGRSGVWMKTLADRHGVGLAMVYDAWFPDVPASWTRVATLRLAAQRESAWGEVVTFYATAPDRIGAIEAALDRWGPTLPAGVALTRGPGAPAPASGPA